MIKAQSATLDAVRELEKVAADIFESFGAMPKWLPGQLGLPGSPAIYGGISPYTPGMGVVANDQIALGTAMNTVLVDPGLDIAQRAIAINALSNAAKNQDRGLISTGDLVRGAIGTGIGYAAGTLLGKTLGAVFSLPASTQRRLSQIGAVGGLVNALGILK
jgi:hypothetical protein